MSEDFESRGVADAAFSPQTSTDAQALDGQVVAATNASASVPATVGGFDYLGLAEPLLRAVHDMGFTQPTAVQARVIPAALEGSAPSSPGVDLMVSSQTGSGKTAAFLLPILHAILQAQAADEAREAAERARAAAEALARGEAPPKRKRRNPTDPRHFKSAVPQALVLCPTRELAQQVAHDAIDLARHCKGLRIASVVGGMPYPMQIARLQNANLVVATPGRLLDLAGSGMIKLDAVQCLVLDEADRMLDLGFADDLAQVHALAAARRQTLMFSATFAARVQQLAIRVMPGQGARVRRIELTSPEHRHAQITQRLYWADHPEHRRALLDHWLRDPAIEQAIVFASTQVECDSLAHDLQQAGFSSIALHGALSQGLRNRRLMAVREGHVQILVATDVAARGLDVPSVTHVFNYGLPMKAEDYTHRIGRTGRAGREGLAVTLALQRDRMRIRDIEVLTQQRMEPSVIPGLEPQVRAMPRREEQRPRRPGGGRPSANFTPGRSDRPGRPEWRGPASADRRGPAPAPRRGR